MGKYCASFEKLSYRSGMVYLPRRLTRVWACRVPRWIYLGPMLCTVTFLLTSFVLLFDIDPASWVRREVPGSQGDGLNLKRRTFEGLWKSDTDRWFWTVFIRNSILRENSALNPLEVMNWANVWYLMCSETGEDIPLTLSIARIESATREMIDDRDAFVRFSPYAISPKGAMGLFQLMGPTAREIADKLDLYYDKSVPSLHNAIASISSDTLLSRARRTQLIRDLVFGHAQKYPGSIEAVTLNPVNNIVIGISYLAYLRRFDLPIEARIGSYNVGFKGYLRGLGGREMLYFREQVLGSYEGYKNKANSARLEHMKGVFGTEVLLGIPNLQVHWLEWAKRLSKMKSSQRSVSQRRSSPHKSGVSL